MSIVTPTRVAAAGTVVIGAVSFKLSFTALAALAAANNVPANEAWMIPVAVEGGVVVATAVALALQTQKWIAKTMLIICSLVAVAGNVAHSWEAGIIACIIAAIPPLWLLASTHLTTLLYEQSKQKPADVAVSLEHEDTVLHAA